MVVAAASQVFGRLRRAGAVQKGFGRIARWTAVGMAVVDLGFVAGLFAVFGDPTLYAGRLGRLRALLMLPLLGTVLTSWVLVCAVLAWWRGLWSLPARFHYTAAALAGLALKWFQATWNLLGFRL